MKILLLNPPGEGYNHLRDYYCPGITKSSYYYHPVDLLYLSGTLAQEHEIRVIDAIARQWSRLRTLDFVREGGYDAIVSLVSAPTFHLDHPFLAEIHSRMPSCRIIGTGDVYREMRGSMFDRQPYLEACLVDFSTQDLLRYLRGPDGRPMENMIYRRGRETVAGPEVHRRGTYSIPSPRWEEFPNHLYSLPIARRDPFMTVLTDFGCPYQCVYCPISTIQFKTRPLEEVMVELEALRGLGYREIHFRDQTFAVDKARTLKLCAGLAKEWPDLGWTCFSRVDVMDEERARAMRRAGCHTIIFGVEFERESLYRDMRKTITHGQLVKTLEMCRRLGLRAAGEFIVGLPDQRPEDILATGEMARRLRLDFASFNLAMPRMGTPWRRELIAAGRVDDREWRDDTLRGSRSWVHPRLALPELRRLCRRIERGFYFSPSYLLRQLLGVRTWTQAKLIARNGMGLL